MIDSNDSTANGDWNQLTPAERLAALYEDAKPQGLGWLHYQPGGMSAADAEAAVAGSRDGYFDYVGGRVIKTNVRTAFEPWLYDRDNGRGAAARAIRRAVEAKATVAP